MRTRGFRDRRTPEEEALDRAETRKKGLEGWGA